MRTPNLVFILSDQHRFCDAGFMGSRQARTPNLDALAAGGAVFENAYSNCPVCVPARGTLLTGLHALRHGAVSNDLAIDADCPSIARALNGAGWHTAYIGKWHLGGVPRDQFISRERRLGFQYWRGHECNHDYLNYYYDDDEDARHHVEGYEPDIQTELALDYLKNRPKDRPFALFLCDSTPHNPYLRMPEEALERAKERAGGIELRPNASAYTENLYEPQPGHWAYGPDGAVRRKAPYDTPDELRALCAGYYSHIEALDRQAGRVVSALAEEGVLDETVVVYTSDHGDMLGSHGMTDKQVYFEESVHVPFVAYCPALIPAGRRKQLLSLADVAPSLLGLMNVPYPAEVDGRDLSACFADPSAPGQDHVYLYNIVPAHNAWRRDPDLSCWRAAADGRFVYVAREDGSAIALFDLQNDPYQTRGALADHPEEAARLAAALRADVERNDAFLPWQTLLYRRGQAERWDESQRHFGFPVIEERYKTVE